MDNLILVPMYLVKDRNYCQIENFKELNLKFQKTGNNFYNPYFMVNNKLHDNYRIIWINHKRYKFIKTISYNNILFGIFELLNDKIENINDIFNLLYSKIDFPKYKKNNDIDKFWDFINQCEECKIQLTELPATNKKINEKLPLFHAGSIAKFTIAELPVSIEVTNKKSVIQVIQFILE
jgi:RNAse (barnase) inhibitor barstar